MKRYVRLQPKVDPKRPASDPMRTVHVAVFGGKHYRAARATYAPGWVLDVYCYGIWEPVDGVVHRTLVDVRIAWRAFQDKS